FRWWAPPATTTSPSPSPWPWSAPSAAGSHRRSLGRRLRADVVDAGRAGAGVAAVGVDVALVAVLGAPAARRGAHPRAVALSAAALGAAQAPLAVALARLERPEAAHGQVLLVLPGQVEGRVARVLAGLRVLIDGGDPELLHHGVAARQGVAVGAPAREDDP